ncbi:septal ring lytic transglycosylase RlpA family protein [Thalassotalea mangrovi]|uniref:Endolytic peptidoglycan transglycosylase RlpA n=1 Tax=Thalassotalea mangrovi TaxID=2572245 RepID=A0A4U1B1S9_9GAMM|nr:septal ring lytic transglycosylase RlpA family protein [Thalassotalea mangrovi]TKB43448.1 septal ring lytic transglycosylase RlpA family protein [Thalassotalea mangrovi]
MKHWQLLLIAASLASLAACSSKPVGGDEYQRTRYQQKHDSIPNRLPAQHELQEPAPQIVPKSRGGNKDYVVFGKAYQVLPSADDYVKVGMASWYGKKFHGHKTSNGEIYDMYGFSAAHKTLPIPTYARVTNLANNKSVIVRINDRGPFHHNRIIDLSYSAAFKLDMLNQGTAKVKVEAITASNIAQFTSNADSEEMLASRPTPLAPVEKEQTVSMLNKYIHVLVTREKALAENTAKGLKFLLQVPVNLTEKDALYRVQLGPIGDNSDVDSLLANLHQQGYPEAYPTAVLK